MNRYLKIILLLFGVPAFSSEPIRVITEIWPPYNYVENKQLRGYSTEIVKRVMKELNIDAKIEVYPSMRSTQVLKDSKRALFFSYIKTPEREHKYKWIGPFGKQSIHFYKRKGSTLIIKSLEDAKKVKSICCRNGGLVFDLLKKEGFNNLDTSTNAKSIYQKTVVGRCDLAVSETDLGYLYWMKEMDLSADLLEKTPLKISETPLYIIATKDFSDEEIALWQNALDKVVRQIPLNN